MKIISNTIFFLFLNTILCAQASTEEGFRLMDAGDYESSYKVFSELIAKQGDNVTVQIGYGRALGLKGEAEAANAFFAEKLVALPDNLDLRLNFAESLLWMKKADDGRKYYRKLLGEYPNNSVCHIGMGNALSILEKYAAALPYYYRAAELNPDLEYIRTQIRNTQMSYAYQLKTKNRLDTAANVYREILVKKPDFPQALQGLSNILLEQKKYAEALKTTLSLQVFEGYEVSGMLTTSYIQNLLNQPKKALRTARGALAKVGGKEGTP